METKKKSTADIRQYRGVFFHIGLIIAICATLVAFEWKTYGDSNTIGKTVVTEVNTYVPPITILDPPPPPPKPVKLIEVKQEEESLIEELPEIDSELKESAKILEYPIEEPPIETAEVDSFRIVEQMPSFNGGLKAFYEFISKKIRYPSRARKLGIQGKVFVNFIIDKNGEVVNVKVLRGIGGGCDEEAIRVINKSPKWNPGKQRGKPVNVTMTLPISFKLD